MKDIYDEYFYLTTPYLTKSIFSFFKLYIIKRMKVHVELPKDLKVLLGKSSFYIKRTPDGDVISVMCTPHIADILTNNVFGVRDKLSRVIEEQLGERYPIEPVISKETIQIFNLENDSKKEGRIIPYGTQINKNLTFDTFEISSCNEYAFKSAFAYSTGDTKHKLLFIYGGYGVGKSHLLTAIANKMLEKGKTIAFFTADDFANYVLGYTHLRDFTAKRERIMQIRQADMLLLDDFHLLKARMVPQEELKAYIDFFFTTYKPMVFSSLFTINELMKSSNKYMEEVVSRFEEGTSIHISPPDYQLKFSLLKKFFAELHVHLSEDVIQEFASIDVKNIRNLQHFADSVHSLLEVYKNITKEEIIERLFTEYGIRVPAIEERKINAYIEELGYAGITLSDLQNRDIRYKKELKNLRDRVIIHFVKKEGYSYADLARIFHLTRSGISFIVKNHKQ
ncbi:MAG: ATP-binding protein [Caldisericaceae bacterium]|nr:ATP-binding protein [Caldisericaceae bacterium]